MISKEEKGFTLAEILMISAIVALIGSIILIFSKGAIEKARIAKLLQFSANIHHALGAYLIAEYKFEERWDNTCPGGYDFCDTSGNGYHGINADYGPGAVVSRQPNNEIPQLGKAGYFTEVAVGYIPPFIEIKQKPGMPQYVDVDYLTVEAWIKPEKIANDGRRWIAAGSIAVWWFYIEDKKLCFSPVNAPYYYFCSDGDIFENGKWYHTVVTVGKLETNLFVNARKVGSASTSENIIAYPTVIAYIGLGSSGFSGAYFKGYIDEVSVYSEPLSEAQIRKLYAEGAKKYVSNAEF